jgi:integrase
MPKITKPLTDTEIKKSKPKEKDYKLSDGQGLYLVVKKNGTKFFRFDYSYNNKRKTVSFGIYPEISLKHAREKRANYRKLLKDDIDPVDYKKNKDLNTFKTVAQKWLEIMKSQWKESTYKKTVLAMKKNVLPYIGDKNIEDIKRTDILKLLKQMEDRGLLETANRMLNKIERIYKYAVTYNIVEHNIIADIDKKNAIKKSKEKHFPAIVRENEIRRLITDIDNYENLFKGDISTSQALRLAPYVVLRPYNLRFLEWSEINFKEKIIEISSEKMKTNNDFVLPLSKQALSIIEKTKPYSYNNSKYLFPSPTTNLKPISENTLNHALMRLGYKNSMTSHGFRAMFSTIAHEKIKEHGFNSDIIESCLAHMERNKVKAAYNRDSRMKYIDEKRELLQWWADWLNK